ncbi:ras guanine nucleotide exchange factor domain-containing protein [Spinellus fusiger]|nr:ras guanine nucleotide exchange factor domain-containing protein [Spinellus fusiger]
MSSVPICCRVRALYSFKSNDLASLTFEKGDTIEVLNKLDSGWWDGWCEGRRGWFPSNYVQVVEQYDDQDSLIQQPLEEAVHPPIEHPAPIWREAPTPRRNNEYRLSLAPQGERLEPAFHSPYASELLSPEWTVQRTEDGSDSYFYNRLTNEMSSMPPEDRYLREIHSNESNQHGDTQTIPRDWYEPSHSLDNGLQEQPLSIMEPTAQDYHSVNSQYWHSKESTSDGGLITPTPTPTTMALTMVAVTSPVLAPSATTAHTSGATTPTTITPLTLIAEEVKPPRILPRSPSRQPSMRRTSVIDIHEPLTWNRLAAHVSLAIHNFKSSIKNNQKPMLRSFSADVVNAIRTMLVTSGTIDKEARHIKGNTVIRTYHRAMMASMSKLVLSSKINNDLTEEEITRVLYEAEDLLQNLHKFVGACQESDVFVQHAELKLISSDHVYAHNGKSENSFSPARAKYPLQNDTIEELETYGANMQESIEAILGSLQQTLVESNVSLAALLFTQYRNLSNQSVQFVHTVEDIDIGGLIESSTVLALHHYTQSLTEKLGLLFYHLQVMTSETVVAEKNNDHVVQVAEDMYPLVEKMYECVVQLVQEAKVAEPTFSPKRGAPAASEKSLLENVILEVDELSELGEGVTSPSVSDFHEGSVLDWKDTTDGSTYSGEDIVQRRSESTKNRDSVEVLGSSLMQRSTLSSDVPFRKSAKLKKFFGDDAVVAAVASEKPIINERPWFLQYDYDPNEIVFNMEGYVKGGTLPALVERMTLHDFLDMNFINTFLLTYRSFSTSIEVLELLQARYDLEPPDGLTVEENETWTQKKLKLVRLRIFNVLKNWVELYYHEDDHTVLDRLSEFIELRIRNTLSFSSDQLERLIIKRKEAFSHGGLKRMVLTLPDPPEPILPRNRKKFRLLDIDTLEMARQLTIMDFKLYSSIRPVECLDKAWSRDPNEEEGNVAVNIRASIEYCNQVTSWVSDAILSQGDIKKRSTLIKYWVQVAEKCRLLNNFNTCMAILSAFDNSSVGRLKRTWDMVGARTNQTLSHIRRLMGANRNFTEYREMIHSVNPPCIPFLGIYLQDLTFIEDGNSNFLKKTKDLINFAKRAKTAEVIREIQQYQSSLYQLKPVDELQAFIQANLQSTRDEDQLYKESLKLEPREREDEKIARLLQESGFL